MRRDKKPQAWALIYQMLILMQLATSMQDIKESCKIETNCVRSNDMAIPDGFHAVQPPQSNYIITRIINGTVDKCSGNATTVLFMWQWQCVTISTGTKGVK